MDHSDAVYKLFFGSLANPHRLQIINVLRQGKKNVGEICQVTGFEQSMVSHNLKRLERCGMVFAEQQGKFRFYLINEESIGKLMEMIDHHIHLYCRHVLEGRR